jgi:hypothetical protein
MTVAAAPTLPPSLRKAGRHRASARIGFTAWGVPVEIEAPARLLPGARALVERLESLWDAEVHGSDLHRLDALAGTVVVVEPETVALIELAVLACRQGPQPPSALRDVVIDVRRNRVGLPEPELLDVRSMVPLLAAALLVRYLRGHGADVVRVRVGGTVRTAGAPVLLAGAA